MADDEVDLVTRARSGDVRAYEVLVERHQATACRVAYVIAGDDAEDAVQEAFVKAYGALGRFRVGSPFRPWLLRIVANEARNRRRSAGRRAALLLRVVDHEDVSGDDPEQLALAGERRRRLAEAIARLSEKDRTVIAYRYVADLSEAETAEALRCPPGTVKSRLSRALDHLRAELGADDIAVLEAANG